MVVGKLEIPKAKYQQMGLVNSEYGLTCVNSSAKGNDVKRQNQLKVKQLTWI